MKKFLPILILFLFFVGFLFPKTAVNAQVPPLPNLPGLPGSPGTQLQPGSQPADGVWVADPEVTFVGKNVARSGQLLDFTLKNYNWVCVKEIAKGQCDNRNNPLAAFWLRIVTFIVVPLLFIAVLATAIIIIMTRGRSLTIMRFLPRFVGIVILIFLSFAIVQFFYQFADAIQGFFLRPPNSQESCPPTCISQEHLLFFGWKYETFEGLRMTGAKFDESVFITLLLTKLSALTYFVMIGILFFRKVILWFFIIVSPIFPLLLLFYPIRNTGKIWIGEFFRWLLYGPLFAILLGGLVFMWGRNAPAGSNAIPLAFNNPAIGVGGQEIYPTAVNILLGGPGQSVTLENSVNLPETFGLYVVALLMLWGVIILPWILLQIFLDSASKFAGGDSTVIKTLINKIGNGKGPGPAGRPPAPMPGGTTLNLPFAKKFNMPTFSDFKPAGQAKEIPVSMKGTTGFDKSTFIPSAQVKAQVLSVSNVSLPTMRDIARYDTASITRDTTQRNEVIKSRENLTKIANPSSITSTTEREQYTQIREKLVIESQKGNILATSILNAAGNTSSRQSQASNIQVKNVLTQIANPASITSSVEREKLTTIHDILQKESRESNNELATSILKVTESTSVTEVEKIREQLSKSKKDTIFSSVNNAIQKVQETVKMGNVLAQVAAPASVTSAVSREKVTKLHDSLAKASQEGNQLAASILQVTDKTPVFEIEKLQERIIEAKAKGEPVATQITQLSEKSNALPVVNRIQTVNKDDYEVVKQMWKENYRNLEVPEGMAGTRTEWVKDDIANIDNIVLQLSSTNQEEVNKGMDEVSGILPFLLMGGFSQTEIVSYLKAKQDAAREIAATLDQEEEEKVDVSVGKKEGESAKAAEMHQELPEDEESLKKPEGVKDASGEAVPATENIKPDTQNVTSQETVKDDDQKDKKN